MEITSKGRNAVRIMADIAKNHPDYVSISDISKRQAITIKYLEKIMSMLLKANLVESMRGINGGYKLIKPASDYTIKEILDATGDTIKLSSCLHENNCPRKGNCETVGVWNTLGCLINKYLASITLKDLLDKTYKK